MELERLMPEFENRGVQFVAVSSDHAEQGKAMADKINAERLPVGYELSLQSAHKWGLYISTSVVKPRLGLRNQHFSANQACSLFALTVLSMTVQQRPCPLHARNSKTFSGLSTLQYRRTIQLVASTPAKFKP